MELELTALAVAGTSLLAGALGVVWGRGTVETVSLTQPMVGVIATSSGTS